MRSMSWSIVGMGTLRHHHHHHQTDSHGVHKTDSALLAKLAFLAVMVLFTTIQWRVDPFIDAQANRCEFILLICTPMVIMTQMPAFQEDEVEGYVNGVLSACILLPIPLLLFYCLTLIRWAMGGAEAAAELNRHLNGGDAPNDSGYDSGATDAPPDRRPDFAAMQSNSGYDEMPGTPSSLSPKSHSPKSHSEGAGPADTGNGAKLEMTAQTQ